MKFDITFAIHPSSPFGVPQENVTVLKGKNGLQIYGDTYHSATMIKVGYGSLPDYRNDNEAIDLHFSLGIIEVELKDNFIFTKVDCDNSHEAYEFTILEINKFIQNLSLNNGLHFSCQPLIIESEDGQIFPIPQYSSMGNVCVFNLEEFKNQIIDAIRYQGIQDTRLEHALAYLGHARYLFAIRMQIASPLSDHFSMLISSIYLNIWKALSSIVGDPNVDKDYQSKYKLYGFSEEYFKDRIEKIRKLRNNYDVAHYTLDDERITNIEKNFGEADQIVSEVIKRYREYLFNQMTKKKVNLE